jgi:hypothetical protein
VDPPAPAEGGQGPDRPLPPVGRGDRRGLPGPRLGQVPLRRQEPPHRPPDAPRRHRPPRRGQGHRRRGPHTRLVHPRRPQALPARRLVLDPRPRRRRGDRLAGRLPLARLLRAVRGEDRPGAEGHRRQRPPPGRLGAHPVGRGLVPALPAARRLRPGRPSPAHELGPGRLAGARGRRRPRSRTPTPRPAAAAARRAAGSAGTSPRPTTTSPADGTAASGSGRPTRGTAGPPSTPGTGCGSPASARRTPTTCGNCPMC